MGPNNKEPQIGTVNLFKVIGLRFMELNPIRSTTAQLWLTPPITLTCRHLPCWSLCGMRDDCWCEFLSQKGQGRAL